jgi:hypothetical protein
VLICFLLRFLADYGSEKFMKRLMGRKDVEDAFLRLDSHTKEECLMAVRRWPKTWRLRTASIASSAMPMAASKRPRHSRGTSETM